MRNLKFHFVRAQNLLCFGSDGIEIRFADYDPVVQISGMNLDAPTSEPLSSNGAGKTSVFELLSLGLFGRTIKKPTQNKGAQILNTLAEKGEVEIQWDDYRALRTFKKKKAGGIEYKVQLWKSVDRIWDKASEVDRLKHNLEDEIQLAIGLSHHAFCNVVVFDDSNDYAFLEADPPTKRQIVENLLDLEQYREYHENAKRGLKELKERIVSLTRDYSHALEDISSTSSRLESARKQETNWRVTKQKEIDSLKTRIESKKIALTSTDNGTRMGAWLSAQENIQKMSDENLDLESKKTRIEEVVLNARQKLESKRVELGEINAKRQAKIGLIAMKKQELDNVAKVTKKLSDLEEGAVCHFCLGEIHRSNHEHILVKNREESARLQSEIDSESLLFKEIQTDHEKKSSDISLMESKIKEATTKVATISATIRKNRSEITTLSGLPKPEGDAAEKVLEAEIAELGRYLKEKEDEACDSSPYAEIIEKSEKEKEEKEKLRDVKADELKETEEKIPYYQYWVEGFGDVGIRKSVIDGIIPDLNDRVAYWMDILCDGLIEITFDNSLKETMTRCGNRADYSNASNGEKRKMNLSVSQAFAYAMMMSSGICPSVVFLDEITGGGIDRSGIPSVHKMIHELARERQVFVTTHNETLSSMLEGCQNILLKKHNDITVLMK